MQSNQRVGQERLKRFTVLAALLVLLSAPAYPETGRVLDEFTKSPLSGVFVFATWHGQIANPVHSTGRCYHFAVTQTDKSGTYTLPEFSGNLELWLVDRSRSVGAYLPGYEVSPASSPDSATIFMRPHSAGLSARIAQLGRENLDTCVSEDQKKRLAPLYRAQYDEVNEIAKSPEEQRMTLGLKARADRVEFGYAEYSKRLDAGVYGR